MKAKEHRQIPIRAMVTKTVAIARFSIFQPTNLLFAASCERKRANRQADEGEMRNNRNDAKKQS